MTLFLLRWSPQVSCIESSGEGERGCLCVTESLFFMFSEVFLISKSALNPHRLLRARLKPPPAYRQQQVLRFSSESLRGDDSFVFTTVFLCFTAWASGSFAVCELVRENGHHRLTLRGLELTDITFNLFQDICWHVSAQTQTSVTHVSTTATAAPFILLFCLSVF